MIDDVPSDVHGFSVATSADTNHVVQPVRCTASAVDRFDCESAALGFVACAIVSDRYTILSKLEKSLAINLRISLLSGM